MVRKAIVEKSLLKHELIQVENIIQRSESLADESVLADIYDDELLRHTTQAILEVMYRTRFHLNSRIVSDSLAVAKLLIWFSHDYGQRLTEELQRQIKLTGGQNIDSSHLNPEPHIGELPSEAELDDLFKDEEFPHVEEVVDESTTIPVTDKTVPKAPRIRRKKGEKVDEDATA